MDSNIVSGNFSNIGAKIEMARDLIRQQNFVQAKKFLEELKKLSPKNPEINYLLGQLYELDEDFKSASVCYSNLLSFDLSYELKTKLAPCFLDAEEYDIAYELFADVYKDNCDDISILEQYAHTARILEKDNEAVAAYNRVLQIDKNNIVALTQLAELYCDSEDKLNHYLVKAKLNYLEEMFSSSIACLKKALNYSKDDDEIVGILINLAKVLVDAEKYEDALDQYLFVLNLEPQNKFAQEQIKMLQFKIEERDTQIEPESPSWVEKLFVYLNWI